MDHQLAEAKAEVVRAEIKRRNATVAKFDALEKAGSWEALVPQLEDAIGADPVTSEAREHWPCALDQKLMKAFLNWGDAKSDGHGYAVFGKVVSGLEVVTKIAKLPTGPGGPFRSDVPRDAVVIESVTVVGK